MYISWYYARSKRMISFSLGVFIIQFLDVPGWRISYRHWKNMGKDGENPMGNTLQMEVSSWENHRTGWFSSAMLDSRRVDPFPKYCTALNKYGLPRKTNMAWQVIKKKDTWYFFEHLFSFFFFQNNMLERKQIHWITEGILALPAIQWSFT